MISATNLRILNSATKIRLDHRRSNLTHTPGIGAGFAAVKFCTPYAVCGNSTQLLDLILRPRTEKFLFFQVTE